MRRGKKPTRKQKIRLGQAGLSPENWLVVKQKQNGELVILHKHTDTIRVVPPWDSDPHTQKGRNSSMRKMKKINGYLVVKFNARELREYEGTALGEYGVIDAELYTGNLDVDRGAMEYDNAGSMEEAVELARGLESELDAEEPEVKVTIVKETDETTEEEEVDAQQMIAGWENVLRGQVASAHYKDVDERTAAHELYGYKAALRDLGLLDREDCYVLPDTFGRPRGRSPRSRRSSSPMCATSFAATTSRR
ncbi:MAG: DUF6906 family protein [Flavonifractor plautii]